MTSDSKRELLNLVERKAFDPVLHAKADSRSDAEKKRLQHVQQATREEVKRYRNYSSASDLVANFKRDLRSPAAKKLHSELRSLHLPTIEDIEDEFEKRARDLGVHASS